MKESEINRLLWELGIISFGFTLEFGAKAQDQKNEWWKLIENIGRDMRNEPKKYYDFGEWIYSNVVN